MASQEFEQFPDCAMPLVTVGDANEFVLNEDAVALLQMLTCPVCPIAIAGLYRTGKSSLLNWLLDRPGGFKVGPTVERCTRGIWIYGRPKRVRLAGGAGECAVLLLDTEGIGGLAADAQHDARVFALAALACSTLVYNSLGSIDENAIAGLSFITQLSRHIRVSARADGAGGDAGGGGSDGGGGGERNEACFGKRAEHA